MLTKIIYSVVKQCQKNWQYKNDETSCLFNAKIISSLLLYFNLLGFSLLIFKKDKALKLMFFGTNQSLLLALIYPFALFLLLSLVFTKKRINQYNLSEKEQKKYYRTYFFYMLFTVIFLASAMLIKG
jgi:hypothetical protein